MSPVTKGRWEAEHFEGLPYRVLLPHGYHPTRKYPLVLFLHGSAERGSDNEAQLRRGVEKFNSRYVRERFPCIVVAPQAPAGGSFGGAWYPRQWSTQDVVTRLVRELAGRRTVDPARLSLAGLSMGAIGGWELLARNPDLFASAVLVCGEPRPDWVDALAGQHVWAFHGALDEVVPVGPARELCASLQRRGSPVRWTEYPQLAHVSWDAAFDEPSMYDWLFAQRKR